MPDQATSTEISAAGRAANSLLGRHWGRLLLELLLIVVGILVALSIDGWVQDRADRDSEQQYLQMLHRDLGQMAQQLDDYSEFEQFNLESGVDVLVALQTRHEGLDPAELRTRLSDMGSRKTLRLVSSTHTDLISTGNLKLIRDRALRDEILRYFAEVSLIERILEKNNTVFVDDLFFPFLIDKGITFVPDAAGPLQTAGQLRQQALQASVQYQRTRLGEDYRAPMDTVLLLPPDAPAWDDIRRMTQMRVFISSLGLANAAQLAGATHELAQAIEARLGSPGAP